MSVNDVLEFVKGIDLYEIWAHIMSGLTALILIISGFQNRLRVVEDWLLNRYPDSKMLPRLTEFEYHLDSFNDLLEKLVTSFRSSIAPRRKQERATDRQDPTDKANRTSAGGGN